VRVDNTGPVVTSSISPSFVSPYVMDNVNPSVVTVTYVSGPPITSVTFYKEMRTTTTLIGTVTSAPWSTTVTAFEIATGGSLTIKAVVKSSPGTVLLSRAQFDVAHSSSIQVIRVRFCLT
jgi:hypothetical protein